MTEVEGASLASLVGNVQPLLCITTLSHRRFVDDAIQAMGLPDGARLPLRYRKPYVAPDIWFLASQCQVKHVPILLALASEGSDETPEFAALRFGWVVSMALEGEILTMTVQVGGFIKGTDTWSAIDAVSIKLPQSLANAPTKSGYFLQMLAGAPQAVVVEHSVAAWEQACDRFFALDQQSFVPFLYLMHGEQKDFQLLNRKGELAVETGSKASWTVHTKCAPRTKVLESPIGEVCFELACPPARFITSKRIRVDSRRDLRRIQMVSDATFRSTYGHLSVRVILFTGDTERWAAADQRKPVVVSRHDIPLRLGRWIPTVASAAAAAAASVAILNKENWGAGEIAASLLAGGLVYVSLRMGFRSQD